MITQAQFNSLILPHTLQAEGGYANVVDDKGGETYRGISRVYNPNWSGWATIDKKKDGFLWTTKKIPHNTIFPELESAVAQFYWTNYFVKQGFNLLNDTTLASNLFDYSVLGGYSINVISAILSKVFGKTPAATTFNAALAAQINGVDPSRFANEVLKVRKSYYENIAKAKPTQAKFLNSWLNRIKSFAGRVKTTVATKPTTAISYGFIAVVLVAVAITAYLIVKNKKMPQPQQPQQPQIQQQPIYRGY